METRTLFPAWRAPISSFIPFFQYILYHKMAYSINVDFSATIKIRTLDVKMWRIMKINSEIKKKLYIHSFLEHIMMLSVVRRRVAAAGGSSSSILRQFRHAASPARASSFVVKEVLFRQRGIHHIRNLSHLISPGCSVGSGLVRRV